jgi:maltodextrin utilization protein YvdJ
LALFKADVPTSSIVAVPGSFIVGLLAVVLAQVMAFLTMTKRSEAVQFLANEAVLSVSAINNPIGSAAYQEMESRANQTRAQANERLSSSNGYRQAGLAIYCASVLAFVIGCTLGAVVVLWAKTHA